FGYNNKTRFNHGNFHQYEIDPGVASRNHKPDKRHERNPKAKGIPNT
ncbi:3171_t:CDS:1, partial [Ambispora leptoticha]